MNRYIAIVSTLALLVSCIPDPLPVGKIPVATPRIVVTSQLTSDSSIVVLLTKSFGALDANGNSDPQELLNQIAINDATVTLEHGESMDTLNFIEQGFYGSFSLVLVEEDFYTLNVNSASLGKVTALAQFKTPIQFESVSARINDTGFDTLATIAYSFQDIPGQNHYMINVQHVTSENPESYEVINPRVFTHLLEDGPTTDGKQISDSFNTFFRRDFIPGDTIMVQLGNISKSYYDFLQLREDNRFNFSDFLGEPINYPTNVEGGLGWFTLHLPDVHFVIVEE